MITCGSSSDMDAVVVASKEAAVGNASSKRGCNDDAVQYTHRNVDAAG